MASVPKRMSLCRTLRRTLSFGPSPDGHDGALPARIVAAARVHDADSDHARTVACRSGLGNAPGPRSLVRSLLV